MKRKKLLNYTPLLNHATCLHHIFRKKQLNVFLFVLPLLYTSFVLVEAHVHILSGSSNLLLNIHSSDVGFYLVYRTL